MKNRDADTTTNNQASPKKIMCVYAQDDESFYRELQTYLSLWQRERYIQWLEALPGSDVKHTMQTHLQQADLILLLISPDFLEQDLCYSAMETALDEYGRRQVPVVLVLARVSAWKESACGDLYALPDDEQPIAQWSHPEQAYEEIRAGLAYLLPGDKNFRQKLMQETASPRASLATSQESAETRQQGTHAPADTLHFHNQGAKIGQQGTFSGDIIINFD